MSIISEVNKAKTHCPSGHPYDEQNTIILKAGGRRCKICNNNSGRESQRRWRANNPEKAKTYAKISYEKRKKSGKSKLANARYRLRHPERCKHSKRKWMDKNPLFQVSNKLKARYNLRLEAVQLQLSKQKHRCAICGDGSSQLVTDHCHRSSIFRGMLCRHCNWLIGHAKDNIVILQSAINYLNQFQISDIAKGG